MGFESVRYNSSMWVNEAYEAKKYAFAADYIRLYAVYNYGGIYMDMDVEVVRSFDELLTSSLYWDWKQRKGLKLEYLEQKRIILL